MQQIQKLLIKLHILNKDLYFVLYIYTRCSMNSAKTHHIDNYYWMPWWYYVPYSAFIGLIVKVVSITFQYPMKHAYLTFKV